MAARGLTIVALILSLCSPSWSFSSLLTRIFQFRSSPSSRLSPPPRCVSMKVASDALVLRGQRVLVTGAGRGIGRAITLICAEQGAKVMHQYL